MRRKALARHITRRLQSYQVPRVKVQVNDFPWPGGRVDYRDNIINKKAARFYQRHAVVSIDGLALRPKNVADCVLMTCRYCIRRQFGRCRKTEKASDRLFEPLTISDNSGEYIVEFDCERCEMIIRAKKAG